MYTKSIDYYKSYLLEENEPSDRKFFEIRSEPSSTQIDEFDYHLLNEMADNARIPTKDLAERFNCSSQKITFRIKNLIKRNIINAFRITIDYEKIGLHYFFLDIYLRDYARRDEIINYLETKPYFIVLNNAVGWADIEPEFILKNTDELFQVIEEIDKRFPNTILKQEFWLVDKVHKVRWLPELTEKDFK
ncbi:MAG: winged helix-turn-helix transcriptional regulator [Candidatus Aenigmarchaeota archaeon]|nr:winged helix-turn-helix transcriptional regulator [Candidatus Aenigmarchaeota archaeon]